MTEFEQIDRDIDTSSPADSIKKHTNTKKRKASGMIWILSIFAVAVIVILILPADNSGSFNTNISSEEMEIRDLMYLVACDIHEFSQLNGNLPQIPEDIELPSQAITYTIEDNSSWFLASGDTILYYSDMDPIEFAEGKL